jgi:hypothetical protein
MVKRYPREKELRVMLGLSRVCVEVETQTRATFLGLCGEVKLVITGLRQPRYELFFTKHQNQST